MKKRVYKRFLFIFQRITPMAVVSCLSRDVKMRRTFRTL